MTSKTAAPRQYATSLGDEDWGELSFYGLRPHRIEGAYARPKILTSASPLELELEELMVASRATLSSIDEYINDLPEEDDPAE